MPRTRETQSLIGRNSPLDRARSRARASVSPRPSARSKPGDGTRAGRRNTERELRKLSRREEHFLSRLLEKEIDFTDANVFHEEDAETTIFGLDEVDRPDVSWYRPLMEDLIPTRGRAEPPRSNKSVLLTGAQERILFLKFNYARFRMRAVQIAIGKARPDLAQAREMLQWHAIAAGFREQIAETNLALVLAMAKRVRIMDGEFADLVGEGNMALMRSVDKFDCERGFKFSTYACRAILKAFSRHGMKSRRGRRTQDSRTKSRGGKELGSKAGSKKEAAQGGDGQGSATSEGEGGDGLGAARTREGKNREGAEGGGRTESKGARSRESKGAEGAGGAQGKGRERSEGSKNKGPHICFVRRER